MTSLLLFQMTYDQQILQILNEAGEKGIGVMTIARHLYNTNVTFFYTPDFEEIRAYVQQYLLRNSRSAQSLVERTERRGFYRLNMKGSADARQLVLDFQKHEDDEPEPEKPLLDLSLNLFDV